MNAFIFSVVVSEVLVQSGKIITVSFHIKSLMNVKDKLNQNNRLLKSAKRKGFHLSAH